MQTCRKGEERTFLKLIVHVAILLVPSSPIRWRKNLIQENAKRVVRASCDKGMHVNSNTVFLACKKLARVFKDWVMVMSPYYPCVWNVEKDGKQLRVIIHIDDLLVACFGNNIANEKTKKLHGAALNRGEIPECLGMDIDFGLKRGIVFSQCNFTKKNMG